MYNMTRGAMMHTRAPVVFGLAYDNNCIEQGYNVILNILRIRGEYESGQAHFYDRFA